MADVKRRAAAEQDRLISSRRQTDDQLKHVQRNLTDVRNECKFETERLSTIRAERKQLEENHRSLLTRHEQETSEARQQLAEITRQVTLMTNLYEFIPIKLQLVCTCTHVQIDRSFQSGAQSG